VRGKSSYVPFWPGGLDDVLLESADGPVTSDNKNGLRVIPPGFSRGLCFPGDETSDDLLSIEESSMAKSSETVTCVRNFFDKPVFSVGLFQHIAHSTLPNEHPEQFTISSVGKASEIDDMLPTGVCAWSQTWNVQLISTLIAITFESCIAAPSACTTCEYSKARLGPCHRCKQADDKFSRARP
jgi:hypothetical protein